MEQTNSSPLSGAPAPDEGHSTAAGGAPAPADCRSAAGQEQAGRPSGQPAGGSIPPYAPGAPYPGRVPYTPPYGTYTPPAPRPTVFSDRRDRIAAVVLVLLAVFAANVCLFGAFHIGYTVSYAAFLLCGAVYLSGRSGSLRLRPYSLFCAVAGLAAAGVFLWHNDNAGRFWLFCGSIVLSMLALIAGTGVGRRDDGTPAVIADVLHMLIVRPLNGLGTALSSLFRRRSEDHVKNRRFGGVLLGLLCALPVLLVLASLLMSADAAFEAIVQCIPEFNIFEAIVSLIFGLLLFALVFSRLFSLRHRLDIPPKKAAATEHGGLPVPMVNAFLAAVSGLYVLFLLSQLAYFCSAFSGILPADYSVAEYARRGFFEMSAVCAINLLMIGIVLLIVPHKNGRAPLSTRLLCLFVLLFSLGLVAAALSKMGLYIGSFGLTRLRVLTSLFMLMMAAVLVFVGVRLFAPEFPYMRACVVVVALLGLTAAYADVDTCIARYNVTAYQSGRLDVIDVETLGKLSDGAVPYLLELRTDRDSQVADDANRILYRRLQTYAEVDYASGKVEVEAEQPSLREFSIDGARARRLLLENAEEIVRTYAHTDPYAL